MRIRLHLLGLASVRNWFFRKDNLEPMRVENQTDFNVFSYQKRSKKIAKRKEESIFVVLRAVSGGHPLRTTADPAPSSSPDDIVPVRWLSDPLPLYRWLRRSAAPWRKTGHQDRRTRCRVGSTGQVGAAGHKTQNNQNVQSKKKKSQQVFSILNFVFLNFTVPLSPPQSDDGDKFAGRLPAACASPPGDSSVSFDRDAPWMWSHRRSTAAVSPLNRWLRNKRMIWKLK